MFSKLFLYIGENGISKRAIESACKRAHSEDSDIVHTYLYVYVRNHPVIPMLLDMGLLDYEEPKGTEGVVGIQVCLRPGYVTDAASANDFSNAICASIFEDIAKAENYKICETPIMFSVPPALHIKDLPESERSDKEWVVEVLNNNKTSFDIVQDLMMQVLGYSEIEAESIAQMIDRKGSYQVLRTNNIRKVKMAREVFNNAGLKLKINELY